MDTEPSFGGVHPALCPSLSRRGFSALTVVQQAVIDADTDRTNLRISSQTGSGKTVAVGLALAHDLLDDPDPSPAGPSALVIAPTRELAVQVATELGWLYDDTSVAVVSVTGGTDVGRDRRRLSKRPTVVVGTPGRTLDHITSGALDTHSVRHVVLDEADQMLDMGFKDELDAIVDALPDGRRRHLVSATFPDEVLDFADRFQGEHVHLQGTVLGAAHQDIDHVAQLVHAKERYGALVNALLLLDRERCLVFVPRRTDAAEIAELLAADGFSALPFSGDFPQAHRTRTLNAFRNGIVTTLVATDVAARGIDVADISMVVHFVPPNDPDIYTHRSGRTGRAGNKGKSLLLVPVRAERRVQRMLSAANVEVEWTPVPTPKKVKKSLVKRTRRRIRAELGSEQEITETERNYADSMLAEHDPAELVARLVRLSTPELPREPVEVASYEPGASRSKKGRSGAGAKDGEYVRFFINWGHSTGATPGRLLAHVCRRGEVDSRHIGAMDIRSRTATFDVSKKMATAFGKKAKRPDDQDPHLRIALDKAKGRRGRDGDDERPRYESKRSRFDSKRPRRGHKDGGGSSPRRRSWDDRGKDERPRDDRFRDDSRDRRRTRDRFEHKRDRSEDSRNRSEDSRERWEDRSEEKWDRSRDDRRRNDFSERKTSKPKKRDSKPGSRRPKGKGGTKPSKGRKAAGKRAGGKPGKKRNKPAGAGRKSHKKGR